MDPSISHLWFYLLQIIVYLLRNTTAKNSTKNEDYQALTNDMITGLLAGFGCFAGFILLIVLMWCLCCSNTCSNDEKDKRKVGPSPPPWRARMLAKQQSASVSTIPSVSTRQSKMSAKRPQQT